MSRAVDYSKPLSREERDYLDMRGRQADIDRVDNAFDVPEEDRQVSTETTGDAPRIQSLVWGDRMATRREQLQREMDELDAAEAAAQSQQEGAPEDDNRPYAEWAPAELKAELKARQLPTSGNKAELVQRLEEDDSSVQQPPQE